MGTVFSLLMWPFRVVWGTLKAIGSSLHLMLLDPLAGLMSLGGVLLRLTGVAGLIGSLVWAMTLPGPSFGAFVASCIQHGVVWLVAGSMLALGLSELLLKRSVTRSVAEDYRDELRMRRRVEREESARLTGR